MKRRYAEVVLLSASAFLLVKGGWSLLRYSAFEAHPEWFSKTGVRAVTGTAGGSALLPVIFPSSNPLRSIEDLHVLGKLEVPRLGMSVLVLEGDDDAKLGLAAGHMPGTALLGQRGNAVISGHRDTAFWPLRKLRMGDRIRIRSDKTYEYLVTKMTVVSPEDVSVLRNADTRMLTLVTCYPFRYVGSAPKRLIVQATMPKA